MPRKALKNSLFLILAYQDYPARKETVNIYMKKTLTRKEVVIETMLDEKQPVWSLEKMSMYV